MRHLIITCLVGYIFYGTAFADMVATYKYESGETVTITIRDKDHVRMESSADSYMLIQEEKAYSLNKDENGQWMVMDMDQMKAMASGGIAGYTGTVYNAKLLENGRLTKQEQVLKLDQRRIGEEADSTVKHSSH